MPGLSTHLVQELNAGTVLTVSHWHCFHMCTASSGTRFTALRSVETLRQSIAIILAVWPLRLPRHVVVLIR